MSGLPRRVGVTEVTTRYVALEYEGRSPRLRLHVSSDAKAGWVITRLDGEVVEVDRA